MAGKSTLENQTHSKDNTNTSSPKYIPVDVQLFQVLSGALSGFLTRSITHPLDMMKIRFQLQVEPISKRNINQGTISKYTSFAQAVKLIYNEEGLRGFYRGHNAGQALSIIYGTVQFWSYEQLNPQIKYYVPNTNAANFLSGSLAGCTATLIALPFDVIRTRLIAQDQGAKHGYRSIWHGLLAIVKTEGPSRLFRGLNSALIQIAPLVGFHFMFYNKFNEISQSSLNYASGQLPAWCLLINGCAAGIASKFIVYPLEFIKKRLQLQGFVGQRQTFGQNQICKTSFECIKLTLKHEGVLGFYKGLAPTLLKAGATTSLYFVLYDEIKKWLLK